MNATDLARTLCDPVQTLGASFYFDPQTAERAHEQGLNVFEFYGLGRAGTLGDVDVATVDRAFTFFHPRVYDMLWSNARAKADPVATAERHLEAAYEFADRTFGAIDPALLARVGASAHQVLAAVPDERHLLVDGYRQYPTPTSAVHAAYLGTILLRELRGGVHIEAVADAGLSAIEACYLQGAGTFKLHGYLDEEAPAVTTEHEAKKVRAEELTEEKMAAYLEVLDDGERQALAEGVRAMFDALSSPVPVATAN